MSLFDSLQDSLHDTVTTTMGYDATWTPSAGGAAQSAKVLYNGPTEKEKFFAAEFDPEKLTMEYKEGQFVGLLEAAADGKRNESVSISGMGIFYVAKVTKKFDGKTFEARLDLNDD